MSSAPVVIEVRGAASCPQGIHPVEWLSCTCCGSSILGGYHHCRYEMVPPQCSGVSGPKQKPQGQQAQAQAPQREPWQWLRRQQWQQPQQGARRVRVHVRVPCPCPCRACCCCLAPAGPLQVHPARRLLLRQQRARHSPCHGRVHGPCNSRWSRCVFSRLMQMRCTGKACKQSWSCPQAE